MSLNIVTSHRLEDLFAALAEQLGSAPLPPLATETILVPGQGLARWLELRLAETFGIAAGFEMPFLGAFLHRLTDGRDASDGDASDHGEPFARDVLVWRLWRMFTERRGQQDDKLGFGQASSYLQDDDDGRKRLQLCTRLAACFDDYQLYRDDVLMAFANGDDLNSLSPHAAWQARVWRALLQDAGYANARPGRRNRAKKQDPTPLLFAELAEPGTDEGTAPDSDRAHRLARLRQHIADAAWCRANLPPRLSVFGTTTMPPAFVQVLHGIAHHLPVHLYVPQPTPHYFGHLRQKGASAGDNALLARFGSESRDFADLLQDLEEQPEPASIERYDLSAAEDDGQAPTLLACLQRDIVRAYDRSERGAPRFELQPDDDSVRVHDCHSPQRELEVVRDQIFAAFTDDPSLQPRDVLVLVPDIDRYAPYAHAVFGPVQQHLPFYVADRSPARELPICRTLLDVLELGRSRLTLADVLHLLENPAVLRRFGLFPADLPVLRHLCQQAGIRWGLDGDSRSSRFDLPTFEDNAWRQGLDRLILGTLTGPSDELVHGLLPIADTTDSRGDLLARFATFTATLFEQIASLQPNCRLAEWADRIDALVQALFAADDGDDEEATRQLQRTTVTLRQQAAAAKHDEPISPAVLGDWLRDALAQGASSRGFLGGGVTIAAMLPMRAVPVRCLFVCGLDDTSFPRRDCPAPFDLIAAAPRPGDRSRRLDDRQLFLDLLLAARDRLHLSYVGHSAKDNAEGAPSVVLSELLDHIDNTCEAPPQNRSPRELIVVPHPLQPWSPRYSDGRDPRLFTFGRQPAARPRGPEQETPWCPAEVEVARPGQLDGELLQLDDLLQFWWHPCRSFLRDTMRVRVRADDDRNEDDEPFALDSLARYQLQDEIVRRVQRGDRDLADPLAWTRAKGMLPVGAHGEAAFHAFQGEIEQLRRAAATHAATRTTRRIDVDLGGTRLVGALDGFSERGLVYMRVSKLKSKDRLAAWLQHLVVTLQRHQDGTAADPPWPTQTHVFAANGQWHYPEVPLPEARQALALLIDQYRVGQSRPLPFFERSSFQAGQAHGKGRPPEAAIRSARRDYAVKDPRESWKYDEGDEAVALCMRNRDPFEGGEHGEFFRLAIEIWTPALSFLREGC